jgi:hypothetical protein
MSDEATKHYVEIFRAETGKWETVATCDADGPRALRAFMKARDDNPQARVRISDDNARVILDIPPVGAS